MMFFLGDSPELLGEYSCLWIAEFCLHQCGCNHLLSELETSIKRIYKLGSRMRFTCLVSDGCDSVQECIARIGGFFFPSSSHPTMPRHHHPQSLSKQTVCFCICEVFGSGVLSPHHLLLGWTGTGVRTTLLNDFIAVKKIVIINEFVIIK